MRLFLFGAGLGLIALATGLLFAGIVGISLIL